MEEAAIIWQDKNQGLTIDITTTQTKVGYVTTISIQSEDSTAIEEINTPSLELAEKEHEIAVNSLLKNYPQISPEQLTRPKVSKENPYLSGATSFNSMLPGTEE